MSDKRLLNTQQAAEYLGTTEKTLRSWRATKKVGIPYVKMGESEKSGVRYRVSDLDAWVEAHVVNVTPDQ